MQEQLMILVNEQDEQIGLMPKMQTHELGILHRAFSIFLFTEDGQMILQKRATQKYHSPGLWTNACCSHPMQNETIEDAAKRRLQEELGIAIPLQYAFHFIYKANMGNGLTEHEFDHVFIGHFHHHIEFNTEEVAAIKIISLPELEIDMENNPNDYTVWFKIAYPQLKQWMNHSTNN
ncbi:MAG: isopentenyl-diphosphate Delta-isomerase [Chitinophagaceae bacterium]|nr:isopentenyl-diphosphate Delta-isomerase [Chitinophagaceae bacterium]